MDYFLGVIKGVPVNPGWNLSFKNASCVTNIFVEKFKLTDQKAYQKEPQDLQMYPYY